MELLNTKQAIDFIRERYPIKEATFYRRIPHIPHVVRHRGKVPRYYFNAEDLRYLHFRKERKNETPLVFITSDSQIAELQRLHGELLTVEGVIEELEKITGHRYTKGAITSRRIHGTIEAVAYSGQGKRRQYWYPLAQLKHLELRPPRPS